MPTDPTSECVCWAANRTPPGEDTADHHHAGWCPAVDPQPDTAPEGPWEPACPICGEQLDEHTHDEAMYCWAQRQGPALAAALNGAPATPESKFEPGNLDSGDPNPSPAPATPAERAVIDAAEEWADLSVGTDEAIARVDRLADAVARLRAERNKTDG